MLSTTRLSERKLVRNLWANVARAVLPSHGSRKGATGIAAGREQLVFLDKSQQGTGASIGSVQIRETIDLVGWVTGPERLTRGRPGANRPPAIWEASAEMRE